MTTKCLKLHNMTTKYLKLVESPEQDKTLLIHKQTFSTVQRTLASDHSLKFLPDNHIKIKIEFAPQKKCK